MKSKVDIEPKELKQTSFKFKEETKIFASPNCILPIGSIKEKENILCLSAGQFSFSDVIEHILKQTGKADLYISTWTASQEGIKKVFDFLYRSEIRSVKFLLDRGFKQFKTKAYDYLIEKFTPDCIRTTRIHAKFAIIENDKYSIIIRTSANLNKNKRLELFEISFNKEMAGFFKSFFDIAWQKIRIEDNFKLESSRQLEPIIGQMSSQKEQDLFSDFDDFFVDL